jgi:hypothetical protein
MPTAVVTCLCMRHDRSFQPQPFSPSLPAAGTALGITVSHRLMHCTDCSHRRVASGTRHAPRMAAYVPGSLQAARQVHESWQAGGAVSCRRPHTHDSCAQEHASAGPGDWRGDEAALAACQAVHLMWQSRSLCARPASMHARMHRLTTPLVKPSTLPTWAPLSMQCTYKMACALG